MPVPLGQLELLHAIVWRRRHEAPQPQRPGAAHERWRGLPWPSGERGVQPAVVPDATPNAALDATPDPTPDAATAQELPVSDVPLERLYGYLRWWQEAPFADHPAACLCRWDAMPAKRGRDLQRAGMSDAFADVEPDPAAGFALCVYVGYVEPLHQELQRWTSAPIALHSTQTFT